MATKYQIGEGCWRIQFKRDRKRFSIRTGRMSERDAERFKDKVESLVTAARFGRTPDAETAAWLGGLDDVLRKRIEVAGLAAKRERATLGEFADRYRESKRTWGAGTLAQFDLATADAEKFLGKDRRLDEITAGDADDLREELGGRLALATARKRIRLMKTMFKAAVRGRYIDENPFADHVTNTPPNPERMVYIDQETALKVADELKGEYRLTFLLARFAGLRINSESNALRWDGVNFDAETIRVFASKTEKTRTIPMLAVVRDELTKQFGDAPDGAEFVLQKRYKLPVLRRAVEAAIDRAGLKAWPKLFQQLRASFATDCVRVLPANTAAQMLGHSARVAQAFYWTCDLSDVHQARELLSVHAVHKQAQHGDAGESVEAHDHKKTRTETHMSALAGVSMGAVGFEPT